MHQLPALSEGSPSRERGGDRKKIMANIFPNLMETIHPRYSMNPSTTHKEMPALQIMIKSLRTSEKNLQRNRRKKGVNVERDKRIDVTGHNARGPPFKG